MVPCDEEWDRVGYVMRHLGGYRNVKLLELRINFYWEMSL